MSIFYWIIIGLVAGWLATQILGGRGGLLYNLAVGLVGAIVGGFLFELEIFRLALHFFSCSTFNLRYKRVNPLLHFIEEGIDPGEHACGRAMALFERSHRSGAL